jgi:hypothetical protein
LTLQRLAKKRPLGVESKRPGRADPTHFEVGRIVRRDRALGIRTEGRHHSVPAESFDLIVSKAVLEEVYDLDAAFDGIDHVLRPGGYQIHKIDLRDYGTFTRHGHHPLEFLTVPDGIYRYMAESTGLPNRRLVDYYRAKAAALGYTARILTTLSLGATEEFRPPLEQLCPCGHLTKAHSLFRTFARGCSLATANCLMKI